MTLQEIQTSVKAGVTVHWSNASYIVTYRLNTTLQEEEWFIKHTGNSHMIGLTWSDGVTMNAKEQDFFIEEEPTEEVKKLSAAFNKVLNNATPEYDGSSCASHDFYDANMAMEEPTTFEQAQEKFLAAQIEFLGELAELDLNTNSIQ